MRRRVSLHIEITEMDNGFVMELSDHQGPQRDPDRTLKRIVAESSSDQEAVSKLMNAAGAETLNRLRLKGDADEEEP